jgi:hypothetical protein
VGKRLVLDAMRRRGAQTETRRSTVIEDRYPPLFELLFRVGKLDGAPLLNAMKNLTEMPVQTPR